MAIKSGYNALLVVVLIVLAVPCSLVLFGWLMIRRDMRHVEDHQRLVLHQANLPAIRSECETLWNRLKPADDKIAAVDIDEPTLGKDIRFLNPDEIDVFANGVHIELGGQWCHYGYDVYFVDRKPTDLGRYEDPYPSRQVAPNIWFYGEKGIPADSR